MKFIEIRLIFLSLCISGCASAPVHYHSLLGTSNTLTVSSADACCQIEIRTVRIPAQVERREIVVRRSQEEFALLNNEVWLAPLRDEIRDALRAEILRRSVLETPANAQLSQKSNVFVVVERFESDLDGHALITATWKVEPTAISNEAAIQCRLESRVDVGDGVPALVLGYQRALVRIADEIAISVRSPSILNATICSHWPGES